MSQGNYTITTRAVGTVLTATIYNADHQNHVTNQNPAGTGAFSDTVAQMQTTRSPGTVGAEALATSLADELASLRYMIQQINGQPQWYSPSPYPFQLPSLVNKSANYTVVAGDTASYLNATADVTFTLPSLSGFANNQPFYFKNSSTNSVLIAPNGTDTIDGVNASYRIPAYEFVQVISSAAGWVVKQKPTHGVGDARPTLKSAAEIGEVLAQGQALSRTTYSGLANVTKISSTGTTTVGSKVITGIATTALMAPGMPIESTSLSAGTTISTVDSSSQVTVSANATASGSIAIVVWPYGNGDGSTTFNVWDPQGRVPMGAGAGSGLTARIAGQKGGAETHALTQAEAPPLNAPATSALYPSTNQSLTVNYSGANGAAHNILNPYTVTNYVVKL